MPHHPQPLHLLAAATKTAEAELARLQSSLATAQTNAASVEARIANGAGADDPALFGQRRDLVDQAAWLSAQVQQAQDVLRAASEAERRGREDMTALQVRLDGLQRQHAPLVARVAQAMRAGDSQTAARLHSEQLHLEGIMSGIRNGLRHLAGES